MQKVDESQESFENVIKSIASEIGAKFTVISPGWVFSVGDQPIIGKRFSCNSSVASQIAIDKVATYDMLKTNNISAVQHVLARRDRTSINWYGTCSTPMIVKPLDGNSGNDIKKFNTIKAAEEWMIERRLAAYAASPLISIRKEVRLIVLAGDILLAYEKMPIIVSGVQMFNLSKGSGFRELRPTNRQKELALKTVQAIGLTLAAVDIIEDTDGKLSIIEVNDSISLSKYMKKSRETYENGREVYKRILIHSIQKVSM